MEIAPAFEACVGRLFTFTDPRPKNKEKMDQLTSAPQQHFGEWVLWTDPEFKWNNFATFKVALRAAWAKVTGGEVGTTYLKKTVGSFEKRRKLCIEAKGGRIKY